MDLESRLPIPTSRTTLLTYVPNNATGADGVVDAQPALVVWVLSWAQHILVAHVVWSLIDDPESSLHSDGVAAAKVCVQVARVIVTLVESTLKVSVFVENDLKKEYKCNIKPLRL